MTNLHHERARHEAHVKKLNPEPFEYAPIDFRREKLWMAQLDKSGQIWEPNLWELALAAVVVALLCIGWYGSNELQLLLK